MVGASTVKITSALLDTPPAVTFTAPVIPVVGAVTVIWLLDQLTTEGHDIRREDIRRLSPLGHEHITLTGRYHLTLAETIRRGEYRPLNSPDLADLASA